MSGSKIVPTAATNDMIQAAYTLLETMKSGTPERSMRMVAEIYAVMVEHAPAAAKSSGLTKLQSITHEAIYHLIAELGMPPSYFEIGARIGRTKAQTHQIVHALRRRGILTFRDSHKRTLRLLVNPGEEATTDYKTTRSDRRHEKRLAHHREYMADRAAKEKANDE